MNQCLYSSSLLDRFKRPTASDLARNRNKSTMSINSPPGLKKGKGTVAVEPQNVTASTRIEVFSVYEEISKLCATISNEHYPNVLAVARKLVL